MRLAPALCVLVLTAACSGSSGSPAPAPEAFAEGTCRAAAPSVLALGQAADRLPEDDSVVAADVKAVLRTAQTDLDSIAVAAEPVYKARLEALVQSTGAVRIRADGNVYDGSLATQMRRDYRAVLAACTTAS
jgi:hypothetical protein